jgi:PBP1b-binding outer membrane lipoprotein LpoB
MLSCRALRPHGTSNAASLRGRAFALAAAALALAGCSGDTNPVRDLAVATGVGPKPAQAPDFVTRSRPESLDYLPVGVSAAPRPTRGKTADEIRNAEVELDALRAANEAKANDARQAGATPPPAPAPPPLRGGT